jgi:hypothetical protein
VNDSKAENNKAIVVEAFDTLFNKRDYIAAERFWSPNYIQHSAHIEPGRDGLFNLIKSIPPTLRYEPGVIVAEGDVVIIHGRFSGFGLPVNRSKSRSSSFETHCNPFVKPSLRWTGADVGQLDRFRKNGNYFPRFFFGRYFAWSGQEFQVPVWLNAKSSDQNHQTAPDQGSIGPLRRLKSPRNGFELHTG